MGIPSSYLSKPPRPTHPGHPSMVGVLAIVTTTAREKNRLLCSSRPFTTTVGRMSVKGAAVNRAGHPADLCCMLASLGLTLASSKCLKVYELPCNRPRSMRNLLIHRCTWFWPRLCQVWYPAISGKSCQIQLWPDFWIWQISAHTRYLQLVIHSSGVVF